MNIKKLTITCRKNPDVEGVWTKAEVEEEMRELDYETNDPNAWISWILSHTLIDYNDYNDDIETMICNNAVLSIGIVLDGDKILIQKT